MQAILASLKNRKIFKNMICQKKYYTIERNSKKKYIVRMYNAKNPNNCTYKLNKIFITPQDTSEENYFEKLD